MRNVARIKLGYYPLPLVEGKRLRKLLDLSAGTASVSIHALAQELRSIN